jgi:hypothetical protein
MERDKKTLLLLAEGFFIYDQSFYPEKRSDTLSQLITFQIADR